MLSGGREFMYSPQTIGKKKDVLQGLRSTRTPWLQAGFCGWTEQDRHSPVWRFFFFAPRGKRTTTIGGPPHQNSSRRFSAIAAVPTHGVPTGVSRFNGPGRTCLPILVFRRCVDKIKALLSKTVWDVNATPSMHQRTHFPEGTSMSNMQAQWVTR